MFADIKVNRIAPVFKLTGVCKNEFKLWNLSELRGVWVVLFFYNADFAPICEQQVLGFQRRISDFENRKIQLLGCSTDSQHSHRAWAQSLSGIDFPLLADVHHTVAIDYNVFVETEAISQQSVFIIDPEGILKFYQISDNKIVISVEDIIRVLDELKKPVKI